ncbi:MAG: site-specific DNA-methyltransferase [Euryarchaeota archaeon]|nr:site-specific DNA-methyltransferase [Euryarchaeota archaeon]MDE1837785.1 site-specific DNA-methyltransferase [Euryarchaeota archaeon]MDE1881292.1 site-specific DNA-methyltransferase [Euryarchaeota archaeon]MDE2046169.1 site-specific DNA-methyltransferase [Thermoplasmata archaeon]
MGPSDGLLRFGRQHLYLHSSERMPELRSGSMDVIVTSPPYNRGKNYDPRYSDRLPEKEYRQLLLRVFRECHRVLAPDGVFFLNIGDGARDQGKSEKVCAWAQEAGFHRLQTLVWLKTILGKGHFTPSGQGRRFSNVFEYIFLLSKTKHPRLDVRAVGIPYADKSNIGRYSQVDLRDAGNVWFVPYRETTGATVKKGHEAPYPVELPWRAIRCVPQARRVLDPFAGTGSSLAAAESLGIEGVGYEPYPQLRVIERRLATPFHPPPVVLLPELERSVRFLADRGLLVRPPGSAKLPAREREAWDTLGRVLEALRGGLPPRVS